MLPIFSDNPSCAVLKLEWNPLQPRTPPPTSAKFFGSLWKNDWRTRRHPLQQLHHNYNGPRVQLNQHLGKKKKKSEPQTGFKEQRTYFTHCFDACCRNIISSTLRASWEFSDSCPRRALAIACMGIFAAKLISTLNDFDWYCRRILFRSFSLGLPPPSGLRFPLLLKQTC